MSGKEKKRGAKKGVPNNGPRLYHRFRKIAVQLSMIHAKSADNAKGEEKKKIEVLKNYILREDINLKELERRLEAGELETLRGSVKNVKQKLEDFRDNLLPLSKQTDRNKEAAKVEIAKDVIFADFKINSKSDRGEILAQVIKDSYMRVLDPATAAIIIAAVKEGNKMFGEEEAKDMKTAVGFTIIDSREAALEHIARTQNGQNEIVEVDEEQQFETRFESDKSGFVIN